MIYTYTLAPAYDSFATAASLELGHENLITGKETFAGGKGINVSRAIDAYGADSEALVLIGKDNCADYERALEGFRFKTHSVKVMGTIRDNLTICHDGTETRICTEGFEVREQSLYELESLVRLSADDTVIVSGRMPAGLSHDVQIEFLRRIRRSGAKLIVDSKSFTLRELALMGVWMVKPNREEISAEIGTWFGDIVDVDSYVDAIRAIGIPNVLVSLDSEGAVLITEDNVYIETAPMITPISTVGAGDSMVAGFALASEQGMGPGYALKLAVAFGSAACLMPGVLAPRKEDIDRLLVQIS